MVSFTEVEFSEEFELSVIAKNIFYFIYKNWKNYTDYLIPLQAILFNFYKQKSIYLPLFLIENRYFVVFKLKCIQIAFYLKNTMKWRGFYA